MNVANTVAKKFGVQNWESAESFNDSIGLSEWHKESLESNAFCTLKYELYEDLRPSISDIKHNFRRSYKSLINSASRTWSSGVLADTDTESVWEEFRKLHLKVTQRVTRSYETWRMQLAEIECHSAFLVWLRNTEGEMVGGGYFSFTRDEGLYAVGAYDRSLFDKPLGHLVQYRAIEELKKRGVRWYKIGARPYLCDIPQPTEKEISIGDFKQGFSSSTFPKYHFMHEVIRDENH